MDLSGHDLCEHNVSEAYCYTCLHKHIKGLRDGIAAIADRVVERGVLQTSRQIAKELTDLLEEKER